MIGQACEIQIESTDRTNVATDRVYPSENADMEAGYKIEKERSGDKENAAPVCWQGWTVNREISGAQL